MGASARKIFDESKDHVRKGRRSGSVAPCISSTVRAFTTSATERSLEAPRVGGARDQFSR